MTRRTKTITVTTPGVPVVPADEDEQGNPILSASTSASLVVKGFAPRESSESAEEFGGVSISGGTVYGFPGTVIAPDAILTIDGLDFQMEGEVGVWDPAYTSGVDLSTGGVQFSVKRAS